jgi:hypothetical protein
MVREEAKDDPGTRGLNANGIDECHGEGLPFFGRYCNILHHLHIWDELATCWPCQEGNDICLPLYLLVNITYFSIICVNLLKWSMLTKNEHDGSRCWAHPPSLLGDPNSI